MTTYQCECIYFDSARDKVYCPSAHKFMDKFTTLDHDERREYQSKTKVEPCCNRCKWCMEHNALVDAANIWINNLHDNRKKQVSQEYAMTLTMPPDYKTKEEMIIQMEKILNKASTNPPQPERADRWAYVVEHTKKGVPHIHAVYHTSSGRALSSKTIKYHWPLWNPEGPHCDKTRPPNGYNRPVRHGESYADYMEKEGVVKKNSNP